MIADLRSAFPVKRNPLTMSKADHLQLLGEMATAASQVTQTFRDIECSLISLNNKIALLPFVGQADVVVRDATGEEWFMTASKEGVSISFGDNPITTALIAIKNFFIDLWYRIKAFFKRMFDSNIKHRNRLVKFVHRFNRHRSGDTEKAIETLQIYFLPKEEVIGVLQKIIVLLSDTESLAKMPSIKEATQFYTGLSLFGYTVNEGVITEQQRLKLSPSRYVFLSQWTISELTACTNTMCEVLLRMVKLNTVQSSLEQDVNKSTRAIDKHISAGDDSQAMTLQYELNNKSLRSAYVFKCTSILQSYVTQMSIMFCDVWENINDY